MPNRSKEGRLSLSCWTFALPIIACLSLFAQPARAALSLSPLILDIAADQPPRGDVELVNTGDERIYVVVTPSEIQSPSTPMEQRVTNPDPEQLGVLATPNRLILEPGERKFVRISLLKPVAEHDRVFRVIVKPVVGPLSASTSGLKVIVGYEMLVIQRPAAPEAHLVATRQGDLMAVSNTGNSNAELFEGRQCPPAGDPCLPLDSHRIYAGAAVRFGLKPGYKANFTMKVRDKVSLAVFQ